MWSISQCAGEGGRGGGGKRGEAGGEGGGRGGGGEGGGGGGRGGLLWSLTTSRRKGVLYLLLALVQIVFFMK